VLVLIQGVCDRRFRGDERGVYKNRGWNIIGRCERESRKSVIKAGGE